MFAIVKKAVSRARPWQFPKRMCSPILCFQLIDKISIGLAVKDQTLQVELYIQLRVYLQSDILSVYSEWFKRRLLQRL